MNSAETSGVGDLGFAGAKPTEITTSAAGHRAQAVLLPLLAMVLAATVFISFDATRSMGNLDERMRLIAVLTAGQVEGLGPQSTTIDPTSLPRALARNMHYSVLTQGGETIFTTLPASAGSFMGLAAQYVETRAPIPGDLGEVAIFVPLTAVIENFLHRYSLFILVVGGAICVLVFSQRRSLRRADTEARQRPTLEVFPHGVAHWHEDGRLMCANGAFARLLRLDAEMTQPGIDYSEISRKISGKISVRPVLDAARQRMIEVERSDGSVILLDERPCASGGFVTIATDVTDRKVADRLLGRIREEQRQLARRYHEEKIRAEASSRAKTSFLAHLSHDIRTPLNHIIGFADLIRLETFGPLGDSKYRSYVEDIKRAGEELLNSFAEILEFAELEAGRKTLKSEPVAVCDLIAGCAARFAGRAQCAGIRLEASQLAPGHILADRAYLERMLANLLDNAIRFTPRGGEIRLAAWAAQDGVVLEVTDSGAGMSTEQMEKLSQPFVLSDEAFTRAHTGIGLGIAIARTIAEQSGGRLAIDSLEGVGTTVAISLPLAPAEDLGAPVMQARAA